MFGSSILLTIRIWCQTWVCPSAILSPWRDAQGMYRKSFLNETLGSKSQCQTKLWSHTKCGGHLVRALKKWPTPLFHLPSGAIAWATNCWLAGRWNGPIGRIIRGKPRRIVSPLMGRWRRELSPWQERASKIPPESQREYLKGGGGWGDGYGCKEPTTFLSWRFREQESKPLKDAPQHPSTSKMLISSLLPPFSFTSFLLLL